MPSSRPAGSTTRTRRTPRRPEHLADLAQGVLGRYGHDPRLHDVLDLVVDQVRGFGQPECDVPIGQDGDRLPFFQDRHGAAIRIPEDHDRLEHRAERRARQRRGRHHIGGGYRCERLLFFVFHHGNQSPGPEQPGRLHRPRRSSRIAHTRARRVQSGSLAERMFPLRTHIPCRLEFLRFAGNGIPIARSIFDRVSRYPGRSARCGTTRSIRRRPGNRAVSSAHMQEIDDVDRI